MVIWMIQIWSFSLCKNVLCLKFIISLKKMLSFILFILTGLLWLGSHYWPTNRMTNESSNLSTRLDSPSSLRFQSSPGSRLRQEGLAGLIRESGLLPSGGGYMMMDAIDEEYAAIHRLPSGPRMLTLVLRLEDLIVEPIENFPFVPKCARIRQFDQMRLFAVIFDEMRVILDDISPETRREYLDAVSELSTMRMWRIKVAFVVAVISNTLYWLPEPILSYGTNQVRMFTTFAAQMGAVIDTIVPSSLTRALNSGKNVVPDSDPSPFVGEGAVLEFMKATTPLAGLLEVSRYSPSRVDSVIRKSIIPKVMHSVYPTTLLLRTTTLLVMRQMEPIDSVLSGLEGLTRLDIAAKSIQVEFIDSEAIGEGTLVALLQKSLEAILDTRNGFFDFTDDRQVYMKPNPSHPPQIFKQIGRLIGLAVKKDMQIGARFPKGLVSIIRDPLNLVRPSESVVTQWLREQDPAKACVFANLLSLTPEEIDPLELTFREGSETVTATNVANIVQIETWYETIGAMTPAGAALAHGIYEAIPYGVWRWLTVDELDELLRGSESVNVTALAASTAVRARPEDQEIVKWFWDCLGSMTDGEMRDFVSFVSGSPYLPQSGIAGRQWLQVVIDESAVVDSLPRSQTCFVQLILPRYSDKSKLKSQLATAITHCKTLDSL